MDFLNNVDPAFPGFPNYASQASNRFSNVTALRSTLTPTIVNEVRLGLTGGTVLFFPEISASNFTVLSPISRALAWESAQLASPAQRFPQGPQKRNAPVWTISDTVSWTKGAHNMSFGGSWSKISLWQKLQTVGPECHLWY
jgi:hypothetical protein